MAQEYRLQSSTGSDFQQAKEYMNTQHTQSQGSECKYLHISQIESPALSNSWKGN